MKDLYRKAERKDFPRVCDLYIAGLQELQVEYDKEWVQRKIERAYYCAPCFLLEVDGKIVGMAALHMGQHHFTGDLTLTDLLFYVEPEHRNIRRLSGLVEACKAFAREHDIPLHLNFHTNIDIEKRVRLLRMHGFDVTSVSGVYKWAG